MGLGFEGVLKLDGNLCVATQGNISIVRNIIESSGTYGGKMSGASLATGAPHIYDPWKTTSSASVELTSTVVSLLANKINSRDSQYSISLKMGHNGSEVSTKQYWTGINFGASVGSLANGGISGVIFKKTDLAGGSLNEAEAEGEKFPCDGVIPYWQTSVSFADCCLDWSANISQAIDPIYCCIAKDIDYSEHRDPDYVVFGPVIIELNASIAEGGTTGDKVESCSIQIGTTSLDFGRCELQEASDNLTTGENLNTFSVTYRAYRFDG